MRVYKYYHSITVRTVIQGEIMKETLKRELEALKLNKFTLIAAACAVVFAVIMAVVEATVGTVARNWAWMLLGTGALAGGAVVYAHTVWVNASKLGFYSSIVVFALGAMWLTADVIYNGKSGVASGWWVGLIVAVVVAAIMYFAPALVKKYIIKK